MSLRHLLAVNLTMKWKEPEKEHGKAPSSLYHGRCEVMACCWVLISDIQD